VKGRASCYAHLAPALQKDKKEWGAHARGVSVCAPLSLVHLASLWLVVGGVCRLLAIAQVGDDDNSAEHGNGDTVAEILADADGDVHNHLLPIPH